MYLVGDLGFSSLVLAVSLVLPVIGFVIRMKWRNSVARKEEIQRLLVFAAQEAARVEYEASLGYGAVSVSKDYHQCEVCFSPTTTRCARCKSVRYCSAKCQIVHWRQGHKEECHPPSYAAGGNNDERSDNDGRSGSSQKTVEEFQQGGYEIEGRHNARTTGTSLGELPLSGTLNSDGILHRKDDDSKVEYHSDREGTDCASETCSSSFSGFSTSPSSVDSFDDSSVCESVSSNELERLDRSQSVDTELNMLWSASIANGVDQTNPLSPKFASLVNSVDKFSKQNQVKPDSGESTCPATISSDLGTSGACESQSAKDDASTSSVRSQTLEPGLSGIKGRNESSLSNSKRDQNGLSSDTESTLQFSCSLSRGSSPLLYAQGSKVKGFILNDHAPSALSEKVYISSLKGERSNQAKSVSTRSISSLMDERPNQTESVSSNGSRISKSRDVELLSNSPMNLSSGSGHGSINGNNISSISLQPSKSEKSGRTIHDSCQTLHAPSSREASRLSACANSRSSSSVKLESIPSVKSEKVDVVHAISATSPPVASPNSRQGLATSVKKVVDQFRGSKLPKPDHIGSENEVAGINRDKDLFPYELFVKLYNWNKVELVPCGLTNCGNSCYANVVLQCLAFTPPLTSYFLQGRHSKSCVQKQWCFPCEFEILVLKAKEGKSVLSPIGILSQLQNIGSRLGNGKEEDAHEFLRYAIDAMQSVCLKEAGVNKIGTSEEETTLVGLTFGGYLRSKIKCMKCQSKSERHEKMMDLTVEIEGDIGTLEEALRRFTATEILDGENKYQCSRCKSYEKAKKKLTILEAPNVLTIALKRFQSGKFGKLNKSIRFPEILNLAPYMSGTSDRSPVYRLYGVVVHLDIMNAAFSGHYVCYVKNIQNKWFKIDDRTVTNADLERVLTKGAYMLLYARCSPRAPRLMRSKVTSSDSKTKTKNTLLNSTPSTHNGAPLDVSSNIESFYSKYQGLQRILADDSSSDSSSLLSRNSDECSTSTDSTRDSSSADDITEFIFGNSNHGYNSPWRNSFDSDSSPSSTPSQLYEEGKGVDPFLHCDSSKHRIKLDSRNSCRDSNMERIGRDSSPFGSGVPFRSSTSERTE